MIKLNKAIIVEGKYDKIRLDNIFDAIIITTDGYSIYHNKEKNELIKKLAKETGIIVLTDSDSAGLQIRKFIKDIVKEGKVFDVFLPQIEGKEKRKQKRSSQGFLGVEGISDEIIVKCFEKFILNDLEQSNKPFADTSLLYEDGFVGKTGSNAKKKALLKKLDLPTNLSTSDLIKILNNLYTFEEYKKIIEKCNFIV